MYKYLQARSRKWLKPFTMSEKEKTLPEVSDVKLPVDAELHPRPYLTQKRTAILCIVLLLGNVFFKFGFPTFSGLLPGASNAHRDYRREAERLLKAHPLIDGHEDFLISIRARYGNELHSKKFTDLFEKGGLNGHLDVPRIKEGHYGGMYRLLHHLDYFHISLPTYTPGAFWSAFWPCQDNIFDFSDESYGPVIANTLKQIDIFQQLSAMYPHYFTLAQDAKAAHQQFAKGNLISPLAIEGLHQVGNSSAASILRLYYSLGVRYATLAWNCHNPFV